MKPIQAPAALLLSFLAMPALSAERTIVVLDASGSMWGQINGEAKIAIARSALREVLASVPESTELGLMVYGHREKASCSDIELAVPAATGTRGAIAAFVDAVNPKGKTPLTDSVRQAAQSLKFTEDKATVILLTDGLETCDADPCALGTELEASGVDFTAHVVGFGLTDDEGKQVSCLAENTGGKYLPAADAKQLGEALVATVAAPAPEPAPEPAPKPAAAELEFNVIAKSYLAEGGPAIDKDDGRVLWELRAIDDQGNAAEATTEYTYAGSARFKVPAGKYAVRAKLGEIIREREIEVTAEKEFPLDVVFDAGFIIVTPRLTGIADAVADAAAVEGMYGDKTAFAYGVLNFAAPAGDVTLKAKLGTAEIAETLAVKVGETTKLDLIIPAGLVVPKAEYAKGGPAVEGGAIAIDILAAKKAIDGSRKSFGGGYGVDRQLYVPAGDYVYVAQLGAAKVETPFSVKAGERVEPVALLNAGVAAINAPGAHRIDIRAAKKDINGNQKDVSGTYGVELSETLPEGEYEVVVTYEGDKAAKSAKLSVKAGERSELAVE